MYMERKLIIRSRRQKIIQNMWIQMLWVNMHCREVYFWIAWTHRILAILIILFMDIIWKKSWCSVILVTMRMRRISIHMNMEIYIIVVRIMVCIFSHLWKQMHMTTWFTVSELQINQKNRSIYHMYGNRHCITGI